MFWYIVLAMILVVNLVGCVVENSEKKLWKPPAGQCITISDSETGRFLSYTQCAPVVIIRKYQQAETIPFSKSSACDPGSAEAEPVASGPTGLQTEAQSVSKNTPSKNASNKYLSRRCTSKRALALSQAFESPSSIILYGRCGLWPQE